MKNKAYNKKLFLTPLIICFIGLIICFISSRLSEDVNAFTFVGFIILSVGTSMALNAVVEEKYRLGLNIHFPLNKIFPSYPVVEDYDDLTNITGSFKASYSDFMDSSDKKNNSRMQDCVTQFLWHCFYLQKRRMEKMGVEMKMEYSRRSYSKESKGVRSNTYFDGRYNVNDVYEEIYALRTFCYSGKDIKKIYDKEVAHYTLLSAKNAGHDEVVCPNCGNIASRSNLIDGCDYCRTKFTIEDLDNRVSSFGFRRDFAASEGKRKAVKKLIYPWIYMLGIMPMMYMGFFLPFLYVHEMNFFLKLVSGILCALTLGIGGFAVVSFAMFFIAPLVLFVGEYIDVISDKIVYRSQEEIDREIKISKTVCANDPLFSIQSFFGGIQNKIYSIHFADTKNEVNAFSDCDLSSHLQKYNEVVDMDTLSLSMDGYNINKGVQIASVSANLLLREFRNGKLQNRKEIVKIRLEKNENCKTQAICAPSILTCQGCGSNLSLLEGKKCKHCGRELNMKEYDWVITKYSVE